MKSPSYREVYSISPLLTFSLSLSKSCPSVVPSVWAVLEAVLEAPDIDGAEDESLSRSLIADEGDPMKNIVSCSTSEGVLPLGIECVYHVLWLP